MTNRFARALRSPGLHFLVLGGLVFAAQHLLIPTGGPIQATASTANRPLSDDEILFREALAMGLDRNDPLIRLRLQQLGELVAAGEVEDADAFEYEARRLGLDRSDVVVRRHLVHAMQLALSRVDPRDWPDEEQLHTYYAAHRDDYLQPPRYRLRHVFFARDRHGPPADTAANQALAELTRQAGATDMPPPTGDTFLLGSELDLSQPELRRRMGTEFAAEVEQGATQRWLGPVRSPYGQHLVWISERVAEFVPPLESVRSRVVHAWLAERAEAQLARRLQERRAAYEQR